MLTCPRCGASASGPNARFCMSCGCQLSTQAQSSTGPAQIPAQLQPQQQHYPPQQFNQSHTNVQHIQSTWAGPPPLQQTGVVGNSGTSTVSVTAAATGQNFQSGPLFSASGEMTLLGKQVFTNIFNRFDANKDNELNHSEFCALCAAVGDPQGDAHSLGMILDAQGIPITARGTLTTDAFLMLMKINATYDPDKLHADCAKLGFQFPRAAFPQQPPPAVRSAYEQQIQMKVQNGLQAVQQAVAYRNQMITMTHNMTASAIAAMPYSSGAVLWRCTKCGSTMGCGCV